MDTATDMRIKIALSRVCLALLACGYSVAGVAADVNVEALVSAEAIHSDNVNRSADKESGQVFIIGAGLNSTITGNDGELALDYLAQQAIYSYDSDKNQLYHELDFNSRKGLGNSGVSAVLDAGMTTLPNDFSSNPLSDVVSGDLVQQSNVDAGLEFESNPRGWLDVRASARAGLNYYDDERSGDSQRYSGNLSVNNGSKAKTWFWDLSSNYVYREARDSDQATESVKYKGELGLQQIRGWSPFVRGVGESYFQGVQANNDLGEQESWGPAVRYYPSRNSYLELSYNFTRDDNDNDDYVGAALSWAPTSRTTLYAEYGQRFFGDAYEFLFQHRKRRLTTSISYNEEPVSFDREFFTDGDDITQLSLRRSLSASVSLALKRTTYTFSGRHVRQKRLSGDQINSENINYGVGLSISHQLTRDWTARVGADYDRYELENQTVEQQDDDYYRFNIGFDQRIAEELFLVYSYAFSDRASNVSSSEYQENRLSVQLRKNF